MIPRADKKKWPWQLLVVLFLLCSNLLLVAGCSKEAKIRDNLVKGEKYYSEAKFTEAVLQYKKVLQLAPGHTMARYKLGMTYLKMNMVPDAYQEFSQVQKLAPQMVDARIQLGKIYLAAGKLNEVRDQADAVLALDKTNSSAHLLLSDLYCREMKMDLAIAEGEKATKGKDKLESYLHLAKLYLANRDHEQAEDALRSAIQLDEKAPPAHFALADFYRRIGKCEKSEQEYRNATRLSPNEPDAFVRLGNFYLSEKKFKEAEGPFLTAISVASHDPSLRIHVGNFYLLWGKKEKAAALFKEAIAIDPQNIQSLAKLADFYIIEGRYDDASQEITAIQKLNPKSPEAMLLEGKLLLSRHEYDQARNLFQTYAKDHTQSALIHYLIALAHAGSKNNQQAKAELAEALTIDQNWREARLLLADLQLREGNYEQSIENLQALLKDSPNSIKANLLLGGAYAGKGDIGKAEAVYKGLLAIAPDNPLALTKLGQIKLYQKNETEGLAYLEKALLIKADYLEPLQFITSALLKKGDGQQALVRVKRQIDLIPDNPSLYLLLGNMYEAVHDTKTAEVTYKKALSLAPGLPFLHASLANFYVRQNKLEIAKKHYHAVIEKAPDNLSACMLLGMIYESERNYEKAMGFYRQALEIDSTFPPAANNLAYLYAERGGNIDVALTLARAAKERVPDDPNISDTLGWILYKKNVPGHAVEYLKEAVEKMPDQPVIRYHLGMSYLKSGNRIMAAKELGKALSLDPAFDGAKEARKILAELR